MTRPTTSRENAALRFSRCALLSTAVTMPLRKPPINSLAAPEQQCRQHTPWRRSVLAHAPNPAPLDPPKVYRRATTPSSRRWAHPNLGDAPARTRATRRPQPSSRPSLRLRGMSRSPLSTSAYAVGLALDSKRNFMDSSSGTLTPVHRVPRLSPKGFPAKASTWTRRPSQD